MDCVPRQFKFPPEGAVLEEAAHKPSLVSFPKVQGGRVSEGLFTAYAQPDGSYAYFYQSGGPLEKGGGMLHSPVDEPDTLDKVSAPP
jgi:hypothetical protein